MSNVVRVAIVDPSDSSRESIKNILLGMTTVWLEAECSRYDYFADVVAQTKPDVALVSIDRDPAGGLDLVAKLNEAAPECDILVVSSSNDGQMILRAMRAGAKEFLTQPLHIEELVGAMERINERRFGRGEKKVRGSQTIAVCGAIGGVGTTSIAVNLGCALAKDDGNSVVLVDLDLALGDADVFLDTIPDYTLVDVAQNVTRLDFGLLKRSLTKHSSGLFLLARPAQLEDVALVTPEDVQRVLGLMKASFTHVVVDLSKSYSPIDLVALEIANQVLLVTQLDLPCLRNVVRLLMSFGQIKGIADKVKIVVNRVGLEHGQITLKKARDTIGRDIYWQLPNEYQTMVEVRNNGVPLIENAPKAHVTQAICALAAAVANDEKNPSASQSKTSGIGKLFGLWPAKAAK